MRGRFGTAVGSCSPSVATLARRWAMLWHSHPPPPRAAAPRVSLNVTEALLCFVLFVLFFFFSFFPVNFAGRRGLNHAFHGIIEFRRHWCPHRLSSKRGWRDPGSCYRSGQDEACGVSVPKERAGESTGRAKETADPAPPCQPRGAQGLALHGATASHVLCEQIQTRVPKSGTRP